MREMKSGGLALETASKAAAADSTRWWSMAVAVCSSLLREDCIHKSKS